MAIKPAFDIQWATDNVTSGTSGNPNKLEPFEFKSEGQQEGLPVPRQYLNFQFDAIRQWKDYLEETTDDLLANSGAVLIRSNNLSDLTNIITARTNLGLTNVATSLYADSTQASAGTLSSVVMSPATTTDHFNNRTTNLTRVILGRSDAPSIRTDLGLGSASLLADTSVVQTSGNQTINGTKTFSATIAGSISGNAATVTNGVYTTGNQTIAGTKTFTSTVNANISGNAATATSVSSINNFFTNRSLTTNGYQTFPLGFTIQWGQITVAGDSNASVTWPTPFGTVLQATCSLGSTFDTFSDAGTAIFNLTTTGATVRNGCATSQTIRFMAFGIA